MTSPSPDTLAAMRDAHTLGGRRLLVLDAAIVADRLVAEARLAALTEALSVVEKVQNDPRTSNRTRGQLNSVVGGIRALAASGSVSETKPSLATVAARERRSWEPLIDYLAEVAPENWLDDCDDLIVMDAFRRYYPVIDPEEPTGA